MGYGSVQPGGLEAPEETLGAFRQWTEENNCVPKGIVGVQAFFNDQFMAYYKFHGVSPYPCGPRTPWPNRAQTAVHLYKRTFSIIAKALADEGYAEKVVVCQAVSQEGGWSKKLAAYGYSPFEIATGRRPPDLFHVETSSPERLPANPAEEDRTTLDLQRVALRAHQEVRQSLDLRKDLARRVMPSDGPYKKGDRMFVWHKDESTMKSEGIWIRGNVVSQEGAMVLAEIHRAALRVNQSKVRRDHEPWHDVAIPLKSDDDPRSSPQGEALDRMEIRSSMVLYLDTAMNMRTVSNLSHHESWKSHFVEISPHLTGLTACTCHAGLVSSEPVLFGGWTSKTIQWSIAAALEGGLSG